MKFSASISDNISPDLARRIAQLKNPRRALRVAGEALVSLAKQAFRSPEVRPAAWPPRKDRKGLRAAGRWGAPLIQSTMLSRSPRVIEAAADSVSVGSDRRTPGGRWSLAAIHQLGAPRRGIPARPFFPVREDGTFTNRAKRDIEDALKAHLLR